MGTVEQAAGHRAPLNRDRVLRAAVTLADAGGMPSLTMRRLAREDGFVLVVDERSADTFEAPAGEVERLLYGFSIIHCLPVGLSEPGAVGTGTVMRPATLRAYALQAGFQGVEVLPIENDFWRFYHLLK